MIVMENTILLCVCMCMLSVGVMVSMLQCSVSHVACNTAYIFFPVIYSYAEYVMYRH